MSDPRKPEQLLGGHAAGILTAAEREALYAAALEDQALFDALADEEALRELLADPAARARLLKALQPRPARPFWRRPGVLALAAGLIGAAWVGLLREPAKDLAERQTRPELAPTAPSAPRAAEAPRVLAEPAPAPIPRRNRLGKVAPAPAPSPSPADKTANAEGFFGAVPKASEQRKAADRPAQLAPGVTAEAGAVPVPPPPPPPSPQAGAVEGAPIASTAVVVSIPSGATDADHPPEWAFTGPGLLRVAWGPRGEIYLLHRNVKGATLLRPAREQTQADGRRTRVYQVPADGSTLDLYWLPSGTEHPERLDPKAPPDGTWTRIR
ncbi:MAG TPA: hypothetical protein VFT46_00075 [Holophagaceae bacterium]|nr:hypothetical protein [Holophagaceae bacterium]